MYERDVEIVKNGCLHVKYEQWILQDEKHSIEIEADPH